MSRNFEFPLSPLSTAACTAAPYATASSALMDLHASLPKWLSMIFCTAGMRVEPPIRTTSSTAFLSTLASRSTRSTDSMDFRKRSWFISSNFARDMVHEKSTPSRSESTSIVAEVEDDSVLLAASHSFCKRFIARAFFRTSVPRFFRSNSLMQCSRILLVKSSPPRCVSPAVAFTSKTPSSISSRETSKVPPPMSYTSTVPEPLPFESSP
mmetsp:Transcript_86049/g.224477  ORF Transcript_86049/g.224477 Transcript_86049/m.224477 type:complete len:210 (+) Transcript_86049:945-1574(+)